MENYPGTSDSEIQGAETKRPGAKPSAPPSTGRRPTKKADRVWLALRFPELCLQALGLNPSDNRELIVEDQQVFYASPQALAQGVRLDMDITTAQLLAECEPLARDAKQEARLVKQLMAQLYQFSPYLEPYQQRHEHGVLLEISQCLQLFGGLKNLVQSILQQLSTLGFQAQTGLAHTAPGAWLLSYESYPISEQDHRERFIQRLQQVPLTQLYQHADAIRQLQHSGFRHLGDVARQIERSHFHSLKKRFHPQLVQDIRDIFDIERDFHQDRLFKAPRSIYQPEEPFVQNIQFDYPVAQVDHLLPAIDDLLTKLERYLRQRQLETQRLEWHLWDIYGNTEVIPIHSHHPKSRLALFADLTQIKLDNQALPFAVDVLELQCYQHTPIKSRARTLAFDGEDDTYADGSSRAQAQDDDGFPVTALKLSLLSEQSAPYKLSYQDNHVPEQSNQAIPWQGCAEPQLPSLPQRSLRPSWIFPRPQAISQRQHKLYWHGQLTLLSKAERIQTQWWQQPLARDYFLARRQDKLCLWVYQDLHSQQWYVQGVFG